MLHVANLPKINFVYIDEVQVQKNQKKGRERGGAKERKGENNHFLSFFVQDLTQAQLLVFSYVCDNLKGFVFAGDTAQTIARGMLSYNISASFVLCAI